MDAAVEVAGIDLDEALTKKIQTVTGNLCAGIAKSFDDLVWCATLLDCWDKLGAACISEVGNQMHSLGMRVHEALATQEISKAAADTSDLDNSVWALMSLLGIRLAQLKRGIDTSNSLTLSESQKLLLQAAVHASAKLDQIVKDHLSKFREARKHTMLESAKHAKTFVAHLPHDLKWHTGIKPTDWKGLQAKATSLLETIDMHSFTEALATLNTDTLRYDQVLMVSGIAQQADQFWCNTRASWTAMTVLRSEAMLMWVLKSETAHDALFSKLQAEVRAIRSCGYQEKNIFHPALFKMSYQAITRKGTHP